VKVRYPPASFVGAVALLALTATSCAPGASRSEPAATPLAARGDSGGAGASVPAAVPAASPASAVAARAAPASVTQRQVPAAPAPASAPAPTPAAPDDAAPALPVSQDASRMVVYTTELMIVVRDLDTVATQAATIALAHGGYVAGVETKQEGDVPTTVVRLKVAPGQYDDAMQALRGLAVNVRGEKATTQDVTDQYDDVATQLASLQASHAQLLELQKRSGSLEEVLKVEQQADQVKLQIDRLKGRQAALERTSALASITVTASAAAIVLPREYAAALAALRKAEASRASRQLQIERARTPEETTSLQDKLAEVAVEVDRGAMRVDSLTATAAKAGVRLPVSDAASAVAPQAETLPKQYLDTRVALRQAQQEQMLLTDELRGGAATHKAGDLTAAILRVRDLDAQLKAVAERARQAGIELPTLSDEQLAALSGVPTAPTTSVDGPALVRAAWDASLRVLYAVAATVASAVVFLWWTLPLLATATVVVRRRLAMRP